MHSDLVLDAGAFYAGTPFSASSQQLYTTSAVLKEVKHIKAQFAALEALRETGRLIVQDPDKRQISRVLDIAQKTGDRPALSEADVSIIALALANGAQLVTDDYSAANVASALRIPVKSATAGKAIQEVRKWIFYCSGCSRAFGSDEKECPLCGNKLKRKYKKYRPVL